MKTFHVKGMHCPSCEMLLKDAIGDLGLGVKSADAKSGKIEVELKSQADISRVKKAIEAEGYSVIE